MESAHALDFVSLLLSKHTPRQAELTLSPYLKQNLPIGTLGAEILQTPQKPDSEIVHDEKISIGWKLNALASAADSLLKTASRLEQEIERETKYWGQVLAVKEQGWPICRLPRERHTLGVRYGFAEGDRATPLIEQVVNRK
jgi:mediator of RNA polymerase II transcription subunit 17